MSVCQTKHHKYIYSITKHNSAKLGVTISEAVTCFFICKNVYDNLIICDASW